MRKLLLTLTAGIIMAGAASTASQAAWVYHRPVVYRAPVVVTAPIYVAPEIAPVVYTAPVFPPLYPQTVVVHRWHEWAHRYIW